MKECMYQQAPVQFLGPQQSTFISAKTFKKIVCKTSYFDEKVNISSKFRENLNVWTL
jgi:hypothetical protein